MAKYPSLFLDDIVVPTFESLLGETTVPTEAGDAISPGEKKWAKSQPPALKKKSVFLWGKGAQPTGTVQDILKKAKVFKELCPNQTKFNQGNTVPYLTKDLTKEIYSINHGRDWLFFITKGIIINRKVSEARSKMSTTMIAESATARYRKSSSPTSGFERRRGDDRSSYGQKYKLEADLSYRPGTKQRRMLPEVVHVFGGRHQWRTTQIHLPFQATNPVVSTMQKWDDIPKDKLKHFVSSRIRGKNSASLLNVVQERKESLSQYLGQFNAETLKIDNLDESVKYTAFLLGL
ncbi:hypothetical protein RJ639_043527 [Escallonia herrerae]|uniref:Retrotransposon gag domain-containing protein n=1 Tax=Escallonia herrerae TaxID=1293975 RepID=A0AA89B153_9ASTE|nr:hypothetical protein RJ639_043527 [Escallonia herrerae]